MDDLRASVRQGIEVESIASEIGVCAVVTHEICLHMITQKDRTDKASQAESVARSAMLGVFDSPLTMHSYTVSETTRGVIHGLVSAGMDVSYAALPALEGIKRALLALGAFTRQTEQAMRAGVKQALADLGMARLEDDQALDLPRYYVNQSLRFGHAGLFGSI